VQSCNFALVFQNAHPESKQTKGTEKEYPSNVCVVPILFRQHHELTIV
jgi:hypothetical protein